MIPKFVCLGMFFCCQNVEIKISGFLFVYDLFVWVDLVQMTCLFATLLGKKDGVDVG